MGECDPPIGDRAAELRDAFDRSFAEEPPVRQMAHENFLAVRVASDPYAIRLSEVSGLFVDKAVTRLPNAASELLGIAGFRAALVPVYDLRALLGYAGAGAPRWLVIAAAASLALAFDAFDEHLRVAPPAIAGAGRVDNARQHVREVLRCEGATRPIIEVGSIIGSIGKLVQQHPS